MEILESQTLESAFGKFDLHKSVAAIGGLLTLPILQANTLRLEAIAHLALASCSGRQSPTIQNASRWFRLLGARVGHLEDPAEDVFVTRVIFNGTNFRILEGLYEANGHHLQHLLHAVEKMPDHGQFKVIKYNCEALLVLSEILCVRAGLDAFLEGSEYPCEALPIKNIPTMKRLTSFATFSYRDLALAGCDVQWLGRFVLPLDERNVGWSPSERSAFEKRPLLDTGTEIIAGLPSALGFAIREAVIEKCIQANREFPLRMAVLQSQTGMLSQNPMIHKACIPGTSIDPRKVLASSNPVEIEPGYWVHFVLLIDDLEGFEDGGILGMNSRGMEAASELQDEIEQASTYCRSQHGFRVGITFIVNCGFGRTMALGFNEEKDWLVEVASDYDTEIMGWLRDFDFPELIKLSQMDRDLKSKGFTLRSVSGLLAKVGFSYANKGHLVLHEAMPEGIESGFIVIPTNAHLGLRSTHHRRWDVRSVVTPENQTIVVRRKGDSELAREEDTRIYVALEDIRLGILRGAWVHGSRTWWVHALIEENTDKSFLYRVWEMQCVWMERIAPVLDRYLPSLPDLWVWRLNMAAWKAIPAADVVPATPEEIESEISSSINPRSATITTDVGPAFYRGLSRPDNAAEVTLIRSFLEQVIEFSGQETQSAEALLAEIVPSPDARQMHAFAPQNFRDRVSDAIGNKLVWMSQLDDAALRIGLGWSGVERPGGTLQGKEQCTAALNEITQSLEETFCRELARFERRALVEAVIANHEAAAINRSRWHRTARALIGFSDNTPAAKDKISENIGKLNVVFLTSRILTEAALCECPFGAGEIPANSDLSRLMAIASSIFHLGGYSDAIHYGGMKPEVCISPAGQVMIDPTFFDGIVDPAGRLFTHRLIDKHRESYSELLQEPTLAAQPLREIFESDFLDAWQVEVGTSLADCRSAIEVLENRLIDAEVGWEIIPRPELIAYLADHIEDSEAYVRSLEFIPRESWRNVPSPFVDQDRQPWRFRRRLGVYRRPLLRLCNSNTAPVLVVPGILRESLLTMMHNFYGAEIDHEFLISREMRRWWNLVQNREAKDFENAVCVELRKLGWNVVSRKKFSEILGVRLPEDPGDVDVLAWRSDGRIVVLECKNLQFAKTSSEMAKQLSKFQGETNEKGRPDKLEKHLKRVALAQKHVAEFEKYTGTRNASIEGALIFSRSVPMIFAKTQIEKNARHLTIDQISSL